MPSSRLLDSLPYLFEGSAPSALPRIFGYLKFGRNREVLLIVGNDDKYIKKRDQQYQNYLQEHS